MCVCVCVWGCLAYLHTHTRAYATYALLNIIWAP